MVCRLYKALAAFTITGFVSATLALLIDLRTRRISTRRGTYDPMLDEKTPFPPATTTHNSSPDPYQLHDASRPYKAQRPFEAGHFGYSAPSEQTTYDGGAPGGRL
ncbi:hypothetical protein MMC22_002083 [Lobaria immixta]|nr:hypothetical protein [Lobaria immixta]